MSRGLPALTPERFQQVAAYSRERHGCSLRLAACSLGYMSLDDLRTVVAEEEAERAAASASTHAAVPPAAPVSVAIAAAAAPAPMTSQEAAASILEAYMRAGCPGSESARRTSEQSDVQRGQQRDATHGASFTAAPSAPAQAAPARPERQAHADRAAACAAEIVALYKSVGLADIESDE